MVETTDVHEFTPPTTFFRVGAFGGLGLFSVGGRSHQSIAGKDGLVPGHTLRFPPSWLPRGYLGRVESGCRRCVRAVVCREDVHYHGYLSPIFLP